MPKKGNAPASQSKPASVKPESPAQKPRARRARKRSYTFIETAGHGYLLVPKSDLRALGILDDISPWSPESKDGMALEEDLDMSIFMQAVEDAGWEIEMDNQYIENWPD
jgi:hypothetical protein